ncbi:PREDICTED: uncharacterized protein LOC18604176 [Theobroma cacao]|uniref:Uncharacterized protein LOC18604176 n=1 Tax=Theobroma cacao TaxID=3641 RepID=A0AB32V9J2_THECC|nr:PREDICTED: uncharacterized protein LOC18604176 [Theobroma cacao]
MMARIPVRFNRIAAAFNEAAMAPPVRLCESSGSDHSPEDLTDLSDLVNSFIESNCGVENDEGKIEQEKENENDGTEANWSYSETKDMLRRLMVNNICDGNEDDEVKQKILLQTKLACGSIGDMSSVGFKRQLMSRLRDKGFDAGLCKSRWEKLERHPAGSYEYVDVNVTGTRYIIEVNLAAEFEIARPTTSYTSLIDVFPRIFVGKPEELKQIVGLMCRAMRESMKSKGMKVPPWRQNRYVQAKWFAQYKRTTNEISAKKASQKNDAVTTTRSVGFETLPTVSYYCRDNIATKGGLKVGYLHAAFNSSASVGLQS